MHPWLHDLRGDVQTQKGMGGVGKLIAIPDTVLHVKHFVPSFFLPQDIKKKKINKMKNYDWVSNVCVRIMNTIIPF